MKVAIYARVSTDEQAKKYSIPAQLDLLRSFSQANDYEIFKEYIDKGESGTISERPQLRELLNNARRGMFKVVLVYRIDRFFRNTRKLLNTVDELTKLGVSFKSVTEPFDTSNPIGNFMVSLLGSVAQLERDTFIQRSRMGTVKSAKSGNILTSIPLYGYNYNRENLQYEVNEEEAKVVREAFRLYTESDCSLGKVAEKLNNLGYRTRNGLKWVSDRIHQILVSTAYYGKWYYRTKYHPDPIAVDVPSLIDKRLFDKAQKLLKERRIYSDRNTKNNYLLSHLLFCGVCGRSMAAMTKSTKSTYNGRTYGPYVRSYYYCFRQVKKKCTLPFVRVDRLDSLVWSKIKEILENPSLLMKVIKEREEKGEGQKVSLGARLKKLDNEVGKCEQEKENILRAFRKGILDDAELASQIEEIRDQERALRQQQEEIKLEITGQKQLKERLNHLSTLVSGMQERLTNSTFEEKRELVRTLVDRVTIYANGKIELRIVVPEIMPSTPKEGEQRDLDSFVHSVLESATELQHTMHKNGNSIINIAIGVAVKIRRRNPQSDESLIKASHVSFYPSQIKKLEKIAQGEGKATAQVIREAVRRFLNRRTFERSTFNFDASSARGTKRVYPRFSKSDWDMLNRVSKKTNQFRTELVREAVDRYLSGSPLA